MPPTKYSVEVEVKIPARQILQLCSIFRNWRKRRLSCVTTFKMKRAPSLVVLTFLKRAMWKLYKKLLLLMIWRRRDSQKSQLSNLTVILKDVLLLILILAKWSVTWSWIHVCRLRTTMILGRIQSIIHWLNKQLGPYHLASYFFNNYTYILLYCIL